MARKCCFRQEGPSGPTQWRRAYLYQKEAGLSDKLQRTVLARSMIESGHGKKSVSGFLFYEKISYKGKDILCVMGNLLFGYVLKCTENFTKKIHIIYVC